MSYVLVSDLHCHTWSSFSKINADGVNSRLRIILDQLLHATKEGLKNGCKRLVIAGDLFHVRGSIDPEVLNPLQEVIHEILEMGISIYAIPGNHDLKSRDTTALGSSIQTLDQTFSGVGFIRVLNESSYFDFDGKHGVALVPWCADIPMLLAQIAALAVDVNNTGDYDLVIHAGIDGVLPNMPPHGLTAADLAKFGFRNVFAGHYHNRKEVAPSIWSVGSLTHHDWGDVDSKAGFLIVKDDGTVVEFDSQAPQFIDVSALPAEDAKKAAKGNYVRFRGPPLTQDEAKDLREFFEDAGALGISIQSPRATSAVRTITATQTKAMTVDESVMAFVDAKTDLPAMIDKNEVKRRCADVLNAVRAVEES